MVNSTYEGAKATGATARHLLAVLLAVAVVFSSGCAYAAKLDRRDIEYLLRNAMPLEALYTLDDEYTDFGGRDVFLIGEAHAIAKTYPAEMELIKYLYYTHGVRQLLMEVGHCDGEIINAYLQGGGNEGLRIFRRGIQGTYNGNEEFFVFLDTLRAFNMGLEPEERLQLHGVDVQHIWSTGIYYLSTLLPDGEAPEELAWSVEKIRQGSLIMNAHMRSFVNGFDASTALYEAYLGDAYPAFASAVNAVRQGLAYYDGNKRASIREASLIENFVATHEALPGEKLMGIFGGAHVMMGEDATVDFAWLGRFLATDYPPLSGKLAVMNFWYVDSYQAASSGDVRVHELPMGKSDMARLPSDVVFVKMDAEQTPKGIVAMSEQQQYVLVVKGSQAAVRY